MDWQAYIAAGIVAFTATVFLLRLLRTKRGHACGRCACFKKR